jgi:hypothetical protein
MQLISPLWGPLQVQQASQVGRCLTLQSMLCSCCRHCNPPSAPTGNCPESPAAVPLLLQLGACRPCQTATPTAWWLASAARRRRSRHAWSARSWVVCQLQQRTPPRHYCQDCSCTCALCCGVLCCAVVCCAAPWAMRRFWQMATHINHQPSSKCTPLC